MLVTDPVETQAAVSAVLRGRSGRVEFLSRRSGVRPDRVDIRDLATVYQLARASDQVWRLVGVTAAGRTGRVAGRGCDAFGLPITSGLLLAAVAPYFLGYQPPSVLPDTDVDTGTGTPPPPPPPPPPDGVYELDGGTAAATGSAFDGGPAVPTPDRQPLDGGNA